MLELIKVVGPVLLSWPVAAIVIVLVFRPALMKMFERLAEAKIGPIGLTLERLSQQSQTAVDAVGRVTLVMAESRLLELETTEANFGRIFSPEQRSRLRRHIEELRELTDRHRGSGTTK
jgi:hypothetical protein